MRMVGWLALASMWAVGCAPTTVEVAMDGGDALWNDVATLEGACQGALDAAGVIRDRIKARGTSAPERVLEDLDAMLLEVDAAYGWAQLMFSVHPDGDVRKAAEECEKSIAKFHNDVNLDRGLYDAAKSASTDGLDALAARFQAHKLRDFRRSGVDKDDATRARLKEIHERMVDLGQQFQKNVRKDVRTVQVQGADALRGMPADFVAAHAPDAEGNITLNTDYTDFFPIQKYAEDESLRQQLYRAFMNRAYPQNEAVLGELLRLRYEYARLLGYDTWAAYISEDKMIKTAKAIESFIGKITHIARPRMEQDLAKLLERKRQDSPKAETIQVWDRFYYVGKVREAEHGFDARVVRPYFPYVQVRRGILDLYGELFGLRFVEDEGAEVWHPSVEAFEVYEGDQRIARFYLDMHPREGKYKHAAMFPIQTGMDTGREPLASLVCNFPDPSVGDGKALMEHSQVVTYFHEFGHLIHHLLATRGRWVQLAGINVEWDFVEAPSQILEEWAWDVDVLQRFAKHVDTGEAISADLVNRMRAAEEFGLGTHVMRQVFYTAYSFFVHHRDPEKLSLDAYTDEIFKAYSPYPRFEGSHVYASFGHLVGYSAIYYTYQWSLAISKDLFTRFESEGLMNPDVARRYRETILKPGGTIDAADMVRTFLERETNLDAYRKWLTE